jgi:hypothetical protein
MLGKELVGIEFRFICYVLRVYFICLNNHAGISYPYSFHKSNIIHSIKDSFIIMRKKNIKYQKSINIVRETWQDMRF